jgi:hypothetical protein
MSPNISELKAMVEELRKRKGEAEGEGEGKGDVRVDEGKDQGGGEGEMEGWARELLEEGGEGGRSVVLTMGERGVLLVTKEEGGRREEGGGRRLHLPALEVNIVNVCNKEGKKKGRGDKKRVEDKRGSKRRERRERGQNGREKMSNLFFGANQEQGDRSRGLACSRNHFQTGATTKREQICRVKRRGSIVWPEVCQVCFGGGISGQ